MSSFFSNLLARPRTRDAPSPVVTWLQTDDARSTLCVPGYTRLADNPEVRMAVNWIADRVSSMTIHLNENQDGGDQRIRDELARKIDVEPNRNMTRKSFISSIIRVLLLEGEGNQVTLPITKNGRLDDLVPISPTRIAFAKDESSGYAVLIDGRRYDPDDLLHFVYGPDPETPHLGTGFRVTLRDITGNLKQAAATRKAFMSDEWKPSVIIRIADAPDLNSEAHENLLKEYTRTMKVGKPWIIPTDLMEVQTVKPLTLTDLAINDSVQLDKKSVASMMGVPLYAVGAGAFNRDEHNNAVRTTVKNFADILQQEMTRKLLVSPKRYFTLNPRSLYAYETDQLAKTGELLARAGLMTGNEVRNWIGLSPHKELEELKVLENYIPLELIGAQKKLNGGDPENGST